MIFLGTSFSGGMGSASYTPITIGDKTYTGQLGNEYMLNYVKIQNAEYDDLFITQDVESDIYELETSGIPYEIGWDWDTILWAPYNYDPVTRTISTNAGNVNWSANIVTRILIKVREINPTAYGTVENPWVTIYMKDIDNQPENFKIANYPYYYARQGIEYEFAIVSIIGNQEQQYILATNSDDSYPDPFRVKSEFDKIFLIGNCHYNENGEFVQGNVFSTGLSDGKCDTTRNIPSSTVELLYNKYPIYVSNTQANYDSGNCTGMFVPTENEECIPPQDMLSAEMDGVRSYYQKIVMDFIADRQPKILKMPDGRLWMIQATPSPTDTTGEVYTQRNLMFTWVEIGDVQSEEDLFYNGFSDIPAQYWRTS